MENIKETISAASDNLRELNREVRELSKGVWLSRDQVARLIIDKLDVDIRYYNRILDFMDRDVPDNNFRADYAKSIKQLTTEQLKEILINY